MAYIGTKPTIGNFQICDAISVVNGQAAYTMQVGSVNVIPQSANHMIVSLNGTIQKPNSSFTVSGSTITFASNLATGDVIDFIQILGDVLDLGVPSDATVTTAKLSGALVTPSTLDVNGNELILDADADTSITADTDDEIHFKAGGNDLLKLTANGLHFPQSGDGIYLGVTSETAANLLDDYEEGDWTPTFVSNSGSSIYSGSSVGKYTKIGRAVTISARFPNTHALSGTTSYLRLTGLPFACINVSNAESAIALWNGGGTSVTGTLQCRTEVNQSELVVQVQNDGSSSNITNSNYSGNLNLDIGGVYYTS
jgi:hypothetical protein